VTWPTVKLGDVCEIVMGQAPSGDTYNEEKKGYPLIAGASDFKNGCVNVGKYTTEPTKLSKAQDIVISIRASIGDKVWVDGAYCLGRGVAAIRASSKINKKYLWHTLSHVEKKLLAKGRGATFLQVNKDDIQSLTISLPPLSEQQRIAAILDKAEEIKRKREQAIEKLDQLAQSTFVEMFGDPVLNPKNWDMVELKQFGKIVTGNTPSRNDLKNYDSNFVEWIKTDNITEESIFITHAREHLSQQGVKIGRTVKKGALLVACIAGSLDSIGRASLADREVAFNQQINAIQPYDDINPLYLYNLFKASRTYIQSHASSGMKKLLSKGEFEKIKMIRPPISLQNQFVATIERVNYLSNRITAFDERTNLLIASLQHQAFTTGFRA
jgi:type I restriction enzyme S subunit